MYLQKPKSYSIVLREYLSTLFIFKTFLILSNTYLTSLRYTFQNKKSNTFSYKIYALNDNTKKQQTLLDTFIGYDQIFSILNINNFHFIKTKTKSSRTNLLNALYIPKIMNKYLGNIFQDVTMRNRIIFLREGTIFF